MGYVFAMGGCIGCKRLFSFNPMRVPSTSAVTGHREPICPGCLARINSKRKEAGLDPFVAPAGAYEPGPECELH